MANKYAGVDISYCQPDVDYAALKSGKILGYPVKFAMIRAAYGTNIDKHFLQHVRGCLAAGLYVGVYLFSTAKNAAQAKAEAEWLISTIKANKLDGKITYPIAYDLEMESQYKLGKAVCTAMCKAFMDTIAAYNYQPMLYTNVNWVCCHLNYDDLKDYPCGLPHTYPRRRSRSTSLSTICGSTRLLVTNTTMCRVSEQFPESSDSVTATGVTRGLRLRSARKARTSSLIRNTALLPQR